MDTSTAQQNQTTASPPVPAQPVSGSSPASVGTGQSGSAGGIERERSAPPKEQSTSATREIAPVSERQPVATHHIPPQQVIAQLPAVGIPVSVVPAPAAAAPPAAIPAVQLPLSDDAVIRGLHAQVASSILWLASWCIRKLKKAHILLKIVHGKVVRVNEQ